MPSSKAQSQPILRDMACNTKWMVKLNSLIFSFVFKKAQDKAFSLVQGSS